MPKGTVVADLGCGDAVIGHTLKKQKVLSYDLIAKNDKVIACDITKVTDDEGERGNESTTHMELERIVALIRKCRRRGGLFFIIDGDQLSRLFEGSTSYFERRVSQAQKRSHHGAKHLTLLGAKWKSRK